MMLTRRTFLGALGAAGLSARRAFSASIDAPKKIAIITTVWTYQSHAQHMGDRFLVGYPRHGEWHHPPMQVVSLYVDQRPAGDLSVQRARDHGFTVYPSIAEALCCGGNELAVDGVVIIGEHGNYPQNAKGQVQYPRFEFFQQVVDVFEQSGRAVPGPTTPRRPAGWWPTRNG
jgi:hypothetical protein